MKIKLKALEETKSFYNVELKKECLTKKERDSYLRALKLIEEHIEKERVREEEKHKKFIAYDHKAVFHNNKSYKGIIISEALNFCHTSSSGASSKIKQNLYLQWLQ